MARSCLSCQALFLLFHPSTSAAHMRELLSPTWAPSCGPSPTCNTASTACGCNGLQALNLFRSKTGVKTHFAVNLDKKVPHGGLIEGPRCWGGMGRAGQMVGE